MTIQPGSTRYVYIVRCEVVSDDRLDEWSRWYETVHIPAMLTVPGIRSVRRYRAVAGREFAAFYDIDSPDALEEPRYREVRGWGPWESYISSWTRSILERACDEELFAPQVGDVR